MTLRPQDIRRERQSLLETLTNEASASTLWPYVNGEVARRVGTLDWASTPLGPRETWPPRLSGLLETVLADDRAILVLMEPDHLALGNDALAALTGVTDVPLGEGTLDALGVREAMERASQGRMSEGFATVVGRDGELIQARLRSVPLHNDGGGVVGVLCRFEPLRPASSNFTGVENNRRRVRNMLALIRSVARRTGEDADTLEDYLRLFDGRLDALARVQAMLAADVSGVRLSELVGEEAIVQGFREGENFSAEGPDINLRPRAAEIIGLALHELLSDALLRHSSPDSLAASLDWSVTTNGSLSLIWAARWTAADANLMDIAEDTEPTDGIGNDFAREVVEVIPAYELDAHTRFSRTQDGSSWVVELPAAHFEWTASG